MGKEWIENTGEMPVDEDVQVDVVFRDGEFATTGMRAGTWRWELHHQIDDIAYWRLHHQIDEDGFITWCGGGCPVSKGTVVEYRLRSGEVCEDLAGDLWWDHRRDNSDIVAYNVVRESVPAETDHKPEVKETNPKDMVGTRKAPLSTVPMNVIAEVGVAMLEGAAKYGRHNYRAVGVRASVYFDATMRHLLSWWEYEDIDPDSQINHITKAITSLVVLRDAMMQGKCTDDRPPRSKPFYEALNGLAGDIIDKHSDKAPKHYTVADV